MTSAQAHRFYFPAWNAAWRRIRSLDQPSAINHSDLSAELLYRVMQLAHAWARSEARSIAPDDFRHAAHVVALGRDKSSTDLNNDETDRVVALFRLLAEPDDLGAMLAWQNRSEGRRKRLLWWIRYKCVESYVVAICREKFATDNWAALEYDQLVQLHMTLRNRRAARKHHEQPD